MALPVFKTGLSMQVDRWVRLPPSPAIGLEVVGRCRRAVTNTVKKQKTTKQETVAMQQRRMADF